MDMEEAVCKGCTGGQEGVLVEAAWWTQRHMHYTLLGPALISEMH